MPALSLNPFKKEVYLMSPLKGQLVKDGQPLANIELEVVIVMPGGEERVYKHQTDSDGYFNLPEITDKMHVGPMTEFAISQFVYALINGQREEFWYVAKREPDKYAEFQPPGEAQNLICDLSDEDKTHRQIAGYVATKCKWQSIRRL